MLAAILPFPLPNLSPYPPEHQPPPRVEQFWVIKGTAAIWGGIYQILSVAQFNAGPPPDGDPASLAALAHHSLIIHCQGSAKSGTVLAAFPDRFLSPPAPPPP